MMLFVFASCSTQKSITSEKVNVYNIYGEKIIQVSPNLDNINQKGVYYIQVIENSESSPYWTKKVVIEL